MSWNVAETLACCLQLVNGNFKVKVGAEVCQPCYRYVEAEYYLTADPGEKAEALNHEAR